jgi:hypothetical protein
MPTLSGDPAVTIFVEDEDTVKTVHNPKLSVFRPWK